VVVLLPVRLAAVAVAVLPDLGLGRVAGAARSRAAERAEGAKRQEAHAKKERPGAAKDHARTASNKRTTEPTFAYPYKAARIAQWRAPGASFWRRAARGSAALFKRSDRA